LDVYHGCSGVVDGTGENGSGGNLSFIQFSMVTGKHGGVWKEEDKGGKRGSEGGESNGFMEEKGKRYI